ncbi:hypothetical protein BOTCAL_0426g00050 [Botryotinia calthae]|uniref:Uncharacterized protein n=1 Tax=Botryotinia calthae TaxID=38488 RepID=A0A4Y8CPV5_9HELO|nr:hypothetical protein BOTCAL_0426g00050 [Botryotinia calthae]
MPPKKLKSEDFDNRQSERRRREIEPPSQDSSRNKLPSQHSSVKGIASQRDSKVEPPKKGGSMDKIPSQRGSEVISHKRSDPSDKNSGKSDPKVVPPIQSDPRDRIPERSGTRKSLESKSSNGRTTSGFRSTTKKPVAGRLQSVS